VFYLSIDKRNYGNKAEINLTPAELQLFFDYSLDLLVLIGFDGCIKQVSHSFERILGWKKEEIISKPYLDFVHPEDRKSYDVEAEAQEKGEVEHQFENRYRGKDGSYIWVSWSFHTIPEKQIVVGIGRDLTWFKQAEEALKKSEERYSSLFTHMNSGFAYCKMIFDDHQTPVDFIYLQINDAFERITGLKRELVVGRKVTEVISGIKEANPELFNVYGRVAETGQGEKFNVFLKPLNMWLSVSVYSPEKGYFVAVFEDITEHKKAEEEQKASQDHLKMAQRMAHLGSWEFYVKEDEALWSEELFRIFNLKPQRYGPNTENYRKFIHPDDDKAVNQIMSKLFYEGQLGDIVSFDYRVILSDATEHTLHTERMIVQVDEAGKASKIIGIEQDITERKLSEQRLEKYSKHLEELVEERTKQLGDTERLAAIGATAGMVGHDIRNPLQAITNDLYLIQQKLNEIPSCKSDDVVESINSVNENIAYIDKIVSDLQDYTRTLALNFTDVELSDVFFSVLKNVPNTILTQVNVEKHFTLRTDATYLRRIMINLVTNAIQAMPSGGKLTVEAVKRLDDAVISVIDTGVGIPEHAKPHIFKPLFTTKAKGQGLGLAVVKRLVEGLGGTITFESQEGKGATFIVRLPLRNEKLSNPKFEAA